MKDIYLYDYDIKNILDILELSLIIASPRWNGYTEMPTSTVLFYD